MEVIKINNEYTLYLHKYEISNLFSIENKYRVDITLKNIIGLELLKINCSISDIFILLNNIEYAISSNQDILCCISSSLYNIKYLFEIIINYNKYNNLNEYTGDNNEIYLKISSMMNIEEVKPIITLNISNCIDELIDKLYTLLSKNNNLLQA